MPGFNDLAKAANLNPVECRHCGKKTSTTDTIDGLLRLILDTVKKGETVRIKGFGTFKARMFKGRKLTSPLLEGGSVTFEDALVLRFHQSAVAKKYINTPDEEAEKPAKGKKAQAKAEKAEKPAAKKEAAKAEKPAAKAAKKHTKKAPDPEPEEDEDEDVDEDEEGDEDADEEGDEDEGDEDADEEG